MIALDATSGAEQRSVPLSISAADGYPRAVSGVVYQEGWAFSETDGSTLWVGPGETSGADSVTATGLYIGNGYSTYDDNPTTRKPIWSHQLTSQPDGTTAVVNNWHVYNVDGTHDVFDGTKGNVVGLTGQL